ncbi:hypothetical protein MAPG_11528 [Magnaporthiopsis poae ATCC 64411]|uniref:Uncharacterized protein n=1 Tax=Magnaporthiopsis poae (strain ATCC 64411 / 73-15) TaxID=644358 RepID=A0A0C4EFH9_MAGP6|nr:hypothetical protein MAPG_11528 [Magnaporthiopsis poae ATCC 64411]
MVTMRRDSKLSNADAKQGEDHAAELRQGETLSARLFQVYGQGGGDGYQVGVPPWAWFLVCSGSFPLDFLDAPRLPKSGTASIRFPRMPSDAV